VKQQELKEFMTPYDSQDSKPTS